MNQETKIKVLVGIASYGTRNDKYLARLVEEYRSMDFDIDIVVISNLQKDAGPGVEVIIGKPSKNTWSLPHAHKQIFAQRLNDYDLFIYSEDDVLITEKNIRAFLKVSKVLPENAIAGFLRFEKGANGEVNYPEMHGHFHWDPSSVREIGGYKFAAFTNEHSACYLVTQEQLRRAINSGQFLVKPHIGKFDLICTAATDPYIQCGFQKLICLTHLEDFMLHHLSNLYAGGQLGTQVAEFQRQVQALLRLGNNGHRASSLFQTESKLVAALHSKSYYEPARPEIVSMIPGKVRSVLSIGCGWGAMEAYLKQKGLEVVAVPLDEVIPGGAEAAGVELVSGDFETARKKLEGRQFDCLYISNVLHLVKEPVKNLSMFTELLGPDSTTIVVAPNLTRPKAIYDVVNRARSIGHEKFSAALWKRLMHPQDSTRVGDFEATGVHDTTRKVIRKWLRAAGLKPYKTFEVFPERVKKVRRLSLGMLDPILASEIISVATKN